LNCDLASGTDCPQLFILAVVAAVSAASSVPYNVVPARRAIVAPAVTFTFSPTYTTYSDAPVRPIVSTPAVDPQFDPNPQYSFSYSVKDGETGDSKSHEESRNGDSVQGSYSVVESDGSIRRVDYSADAVNGFNAVVHRDVGAAPPPPVPAAPAVAYKPIPAVAYQPAPSVAYKPAPSVTYKPASAVAYKSVPAVAYESVPAVAFNSIPAVEYQPAPAIRRVIPSTSVTYSSVAPALPQPSTVRTFFKSPFASYEY
jgi:hypothetical protein